MLKLDTRRLPYRAQSRFELHKVAQFCWSSCHVAHRNFTVIFFRSFANGSSRWSWSHSNRDHESTCWYLATSHTCTIWVEHRRISASVKAFIWKLEIIRLISYLFVIASSPLFLTIALKTVEHQLTDYFVMLWLTRIQSSASENSHSIGLSSSKPFIALFFSCELIPLRRSLSRDNKHTKEKEQIIKLIRTIVVVGSERRDPHGAAGSGTVPLSDPVMRAFIAVAEHAEDPFRPICVQTLAEIR